MGDYDIIQTLIMGIGFIIIFWHQRHQIKSLRTTIEGQKNILDSVNIFFKLFDPQKLEGYTDLRVETATMEIKKVMEKEVEKVKTEYERKLEELKNKDKKLYFLQEELYIAYSALIDFYFYIPSNIFSEIIDDLDDSMTKEHLQRMHQKFEGQTGDMGLLGRLALLREMHKRAAKK